MKAPAAADLTPRPELCCNSPLLPYSIVERNLRAAMRAYAKSTAGGEAVDRDGVSLTSCGTDIAVFNSALLSAPVGVAELDRAVSVAAGHFAALRFGWSFWLCDDLFAGHNRVLSQATLQKHGLALVAQPPGMYADQLTAPVRPPAGLEYRRIVDDRTRLEFAHVSSIVFALPFASACRMYGGAPIWDTMTGWIGFFEGKAVSVVTVVIEAGAAGVYSLGTLPQYQGRGFGEALLRHALDHVQKETGITRTVLEATDQGFGLYLRLGYRVVTSFSVYTRETAGPV